MLKLWFDFDPTVPFSQNPCPGFQESESISSGFLNSHLNIDESDLKIEFWKQPDGMGYRPCLDFSKNYLKDSGEIMKDRTKYLVVVVSGGMNQQRNQIVDVVVIARILGAALVVPILQVNVIWGDESEFGVRVMVAARTRRVTALLNSGGEHGQVMVAAIVQVSDLGYWGPIEMGFCSDLGGLWIGCFLADLGDEFSGWASLGTLRRLSFRSPGFVTEGRRSAGVQPLATATVVGFTGYGLRWAEVGCKMGYLFASMCAYVLQIMGVKDMGG